MIQHFYSLEHRAVWKLGSNIYIMKRGEGDVFQRRKTLGEQIQESLDRLRSMVTSFPHQRSTSLKASPFWLPKRLQWAKDKDFALFIKIGVVDIKAEWKWATAAKTVFNKFVALFRPLAKMVNEGRIKGYGCPKVRIIHSRRVETP